jgi:hypothetical protein
MDGLTALGALGSASTFAGSTQPDPAAVAAPAISPQAAAAAAPDPAHAAADIYPPSPTPAVERADIADLPLAVEYAPSSVPRDLEPAAHFDRTA